VNREEKASAIERMKGSFTSTPHVILTAFQGLGANQANELRRRVRGAGGRFEVLKNRLAKRAAAGTPIAPLVDRFSGPCALASHRSDAVLLAKTLSEFSKDNPQLELVAGIIDARDVVDGKDVKRLASLPGLNELRAQLLSLIQTPATSLVRLLGTPGTQLARVLDAHAEKQGQG
jgi:large subunit ribosomal protein L10